MSNQIEQKPAVQPINTPQNPETPIEPPIVNPEEILSAGGSENGGIYFELNWDTGQAHHRQRQLLTIYSGSPPEFPVEEFPIEGAGYNPNGNGNGFGLNGFGNPHENFPYVYNDNSTNPNYPFGSDDPNFLYSFENQNLVSWNDLMDLLGNSPEFSHYQNESNEFWRELQRFSETTIFQTNGLTENELFPNNYDIETENFSTYERLLNKFKSKEVPLDDFVESLPSKERDLFRARYQLDEMLGEDAFRPDGVTLTETAQVRLIETAVADDLIEFLPENVRREIREGKTFAVGEDGTIVLVSRETEQNQTDDAEIALTNDGAFAPNYLISEKIKADELRPADKSAQIAVGQNNAVVLTDNGTTRTVNHNQIDNSSSISSIARRDGGTILGGALISGSFSSIENFQNAESRGVDNSNSVENNNIGGRNNFEAGATGTMMSAAIGSLVPSSDAVISGVVGFISGVVIGVEADQGLRWLSSDRPTAIAPTGNIDLLEENSFAPTLQPILT